MKNSSPWLHNLNRIRKVDTLTHNVSTDIAIVGGGIAGVATAFFLLTYTKKNVLLIDADKIAHGATGHNAGQIVTYFERPFTDIVKEHGLEQAAQAQKDIIGAWALLKEIYDTAKVETPLAEFTGYAGCSTIDQVIHHLENKHLREKAEIQMESVFLSKSISIAKIPKEYRTYIQLLPHKEILALLETKDKQYIAALSSKKGLLNSARFCEEVIGYLVFKYKKRFSLYEHSLVAQVNLHKDHAILKSRNYRIRASRVILCTNGFEKIEIKNNHGIDIDTKFHDHITGVVGYMAAYETNIQRGQAAISYFPQYLNGFIDPYFYLTRRNYLGSKTHSLTCIGGPEIRLAHKEIYKKNKNYLPSSTKTIKKFITKTIDHPLDKKHLFHWHGLMGYTATGLRIIGPEPCNSTLLYNLGCNGIGILPSIYGGKRISLFIQGARLARSIFDPFDQVCESPRRNKY